MRLTIEKQKLTWIDPAWNVAHPDRKSRSFYICGRIRCFSVILFEFD